MTVKAFQICLLDDVLNGIVAALNDSPVAQDHNSNVNQGSALHDHRKRIG
jgi:hypothetical protein